MAKLLPIIALVLFAAIGVAAGKFLQPQPEIVEQDTDEAASESAADEPMPEKQHVPGTTPEMMDYVKLNNQFVIPIVVQDRVASLVVLSLSIEVPEGQQDAVLKREPKLRDSFLQVLFNHANIGGFEGEFTSPIKLDRLRHALKEIAQRDIGIDTVSDVLILEIARQDY